MKIVNEVKIASILHIPYPVNTLLILQQVLDKTAHFKVKLITIIGHYIVLFGHILI